MQANQNSKSSDPSDASGAESDKFDTNSKFMVQMTD